LPHVIEAIILLQVALSFDSHSTSQEVLLGIIWHLLLSTQCALKPSL